VWNSIAASRREQHYRKLQARSVILQVLLFVTCLSVISLGQTNDLTVVVLMNSSNTTGYNVSGEYQRYPERYLEHLQIPYRIVDVSSSSAEDMTGARLIIAAHRGLNLSPDWQQAIITAVAGGTGFVNLDSDPAIGTDAHIRTIFGATGSVTGTQALLSR